MCYKPHTHITILFINNAEMKNNLLKTYKHKTKSPDTDIDFFRNQQSVTCKLLYYLQAATK